MGTDTPQHSVLDSSFPVDFPHHDAFTLPNAQFEEFLRNELRQQDSVSAAGIKPWPRVSRAPSVSDADDLLMTPGLADSLSQDQSTAAPLLEVSRPEEHQSFLGALKKGSDSKLVRGFENKMLTDNADVAFRSTTSPLVDLFSELEHVITGERLCELLNAGWKEDPLATLKLIFNARSIHLGKSSRLSFYRCVGWLAQTHPLTLLLNLRWLNRPLIEKKITKKEEIHEVFELLEVEKNEDDLTRFDVKHGVSHGYYKDLLNILALAVNDKLNALTDPREVLNVETKRKDRKYIEWNSDKARELRHDVQASRHATAVSKFQNDSFYRCLYITVVRIFAEQIANDLQLLRSENAKARRGISLCAKWAPSHKLFHDKHTFIVTSIAEALHPQSHSAIAAPAHRILYLKHARESYRKDVSSLRRALAVVERDISAETFDKIKYERVPSLAMNRYSGLFVRKDTDRFETYIENVAKGKQRISGATLLPSKLISQARACGPRTRASFGVVAARKSERSAKALVDWKMEQMEAKVCDGQWKALVQRIKDSGSLDSVIAVCDTSGSMTGPVFPDGTCPMDSAIGLSLLMAEVTPPPFGGAFITFSNKPSLQSIDLSKSLTEKVLDMQRSLWAMNTDFVAVFEKLILPLARKHKVEKEDMVKRIFVFSDMQFDMANRGTDRWSSSYERIQSQYELYGYEMPEMVFWNLAGGRGGVAPKPVTAEQPGTALVTGYSQALLKVFLDNGSFEEQKTEDEIVEVAVDGDDDAMLIETRKKVKLDPTMICKKAISHQAYSMLKVFD